MCFSISRDSIDLSNEALHLIPITDYSFSNPDMLDSRLDHGFKDVIYFFPTWGELLERSKGRLEGYETYMAYLLCKHKGNEIIGLIAVELKSYNELKSKVQALVPELNTYLYLSWIALDRKYQQVNYFSLLFEFYHALIRRLQNQLGTRIGGAAIAIRRMRPILWSLLNTDDECPLRVDVPIYRKSAKITYYMKPSELIDQEMKPIQDHVLILFDSIKNRRQQNH